MVKIVDFLYDLLFNFVLKIVLLKCIEVLNFEVLVFLLKFKIGVKLCDVMFGNNFVLILFECLVEEFICMD